MAQAFTKQAQLEQTGNEIDTEMQETEGSSGSQLAAVCVGVKGSNRAHFHYKAVLSATELSEVQTPKDDFCGYHALGAAKARTCDANIDGSNPVEINAATKLRRGLNEYASEELPAMVQDGTLDLAELCRDRLNQAVLEPDAITKMQAYFDTVSKLPGDKSAAREYWAGEA